MKKLTKREKLLLYSLGCFLIGFFGIYFVIMPSFSSFQVVNDQVAEARFTQESMTMAIDAIPATMQARDDAIASLASLKAMFPPQKTNEQLDMLLTQLCLDYSLSPKVLTISSNGSGEVLTFVPDVSEQLLSEKMEGDESNPSISEIITDTAAALTGEESSEEATTTESADGSTNTEGITAMIGVVSMELTGTQTNFYRLLDAVDARSEIIVTAFSIVPETQTASAGSTNTMSKLDGGNSVISVTFEVYMMAQ